MSGLIFKKKMVGGRERVTTCSSAGTARRLKKDKVVNIPRLGGCKNFVGDREKLYI